MAFTGKGGTVKYGGTAVTEVNTWSFNFAPSDAVEYSTFAGKFTVPGPAGAPTGSFTCYSAPVYDECPASITLVAGGSGTCDETTSVAVIGSAFTTGYSLESPSDGIVQFTVEFAYTSTPTISTTVA